MTDLTGERLSLRRQHRLLEFDLGGERVYPDYAGNSILNVPATVCHWLQVEPLGAPALDAGLIDALGDGIRHVVLVLMDSLALHRLQRWMSDGTAPVWNDLVQQGVLAPLTSIVPSTTSAAMTSLWTGRSPYEHGVMGYEMWMKEYGLIANMITLAPAAFNGGTGSLAQAGFHPEAYLPFPTMGHHLQAGGVEAHAFLHYTIAGSGLSRMIFKETELHPIGSSADLWIEVRRLLEARRSQRLYSWVYWSNLDHIGHLYGPDSEHAAAEFGAFSQAFETFFLQRLDKDVREQTAVILLADHGMVHTEKDAYFDLNQHPGLDRRLHMQPTGENRLMYLHTRPGQIEAVREYIDRTWLGRFRVVDAGYAAESGIFGSGARHPHLGDRLGELVVFPDEKMYLWWAPKENPLLGRHGGLHPEEMLVPFLAVRLG